MNEDIPLSVQETGMNDAGDKESKVVLPTTKKPISPTVRPTIQLILRYGNLEQQMGDVFGVPLLSSNPSLSFLRVTKELQNAGGQKFSNLYTAALNGQKVLPPGCNFEIPLVGGSYSLKCKYVMFIVCNPWDGPDGSSLKNMRKGIHDFLEKCQSRSVECVIMSAIGTGAALDIHNDVAATIIGEEICNFVMRYPDTSIKKIHIVIKKHLENEVIFITFRETLLAMDLGDKIIFCNEAGVCFPKIQTGECMKRNIGRLSVFAVYGDIVNETTNAIVNSTNFKKWSSDSVAYAIFSATGKEIEREVKEEKIRKGSNYSNGILMTRGGRLSHVNWILHCDCYRKLDNIKDLVKSILFKCDSIGLQSVAIPAIGTGECRLCPQKVANHIMEAISSKVKDSNLCTLSTVRLVAKSPCIYHIFCAELGKFSVL